MKIKIIFLIICSFSSISSPLGPTHLRGTGKNLTKIPSVVLSTLSENSEHPSLTWLYKMFELAVSKGNVVAQNAIQNAIDMWNAGYEKNPMATLMTSGTLCLLGGYCLVEGCFYFAKKCCCNCLRNKKKAE